MVRRLPPELLELAGTQSGVLLGKQLRSVVGDRRLSAVVHDGEVIRLWRNAYVLPGAAVDPAVRLAAASLTLGRPVTACLHTAAALYGCDLTGDARTHIMAARDWSSELDGLVQHRWTPIRPAALQHGMRCADLAETVVRVASCERMPERVLATLDAALHRTALPIAALAAVAGELRVRGVRLVRELIPLADGRAESPGESWLRWVCIEADLPRPTPQCVVLLDGVRHRLDLGWPELRAGCEYDGVEFHTGAALTRDRIRANRLQRAGWLLHGVTAPMIWHERPALVAGIRSMLAERAG